MSAATASKPPTQITRPNLRTLSFWTSVWLPTKEIGMATTKAASAPAKFSLRIKNIARAVRNTPILSRKVATKMGVERQEHKVFGSFGSPESKCFAHFCNQLLGIAAEIRVAYLNGIAKSERLQRIWQFARLGHARAIN